jgi:hypothetical protein
LFKKYGEYCGVGIPYMDIQQLLKHELKEITDTDSGFVKSAVDQLIEELGVMAQRQMILENQDYRVTHVDLKNDLSLKVLAIKFNQIYPTFKQFAKQTGYEGDQIDKKSYMQQFEQCSYMFSKSHIVKINDIP